MKKYVYLKGNITQYIIILANGVLATLISSMDLSVFSKYSTMEHLSFITKGGGWILNIRDDEVLSNPISCLFPRGYVTPENQFLIIPGPGGSTESQVISCRIPSPRVFSLLQMCHVSTSLSSPGS